MSSLALRAFAAWDYRDAEAPVAPEPSETHVPVRVPEIIGVSEEEVTLRIQGAVAEAEQRWIALAAETEERRANQIRAALDSFRNERETYFRKAEAEIVQLALAIARKILHRESRLDPDVLTALVRLGLERIGAEGKVTLRVAPGDVAWWQERILLLGGGREYHIAGEDALQRGDCIIETEVGSADFGLHAQLRELEAGLFELLELRPEAGKRLL